MVTRRMRLGWVSWDEKGWDGGRKRKGKGGRERRERLRKDKGKGKGNVKRKVEW